MSFRACTVELLEPLKFKSKIIQYLKSRSTFNGKITIRKDQVLFDDIDHCELKPYSLSESEGLSSNSSLIGEVSVGVTGALFTMDKLVW